MSRKKFFAVMLFLSLLNPLFAEDSGQMIKNALDQFQDVLQNISIDVEKVAISSITTNNSNEIDTVSVQDQILDILLGSGKFKVIDRTSLEALLKEQSFSLSGMVDNESMVEAGKLIGVEGFFFGNVNLMKDKVVFTIKLIDVASSALVFSKTFVGKAYNSIEIGFTGGYTSGTMFDSLYSYYDETGDIHNFLKAEDYSDQPISGIQAAFFYIQGFNNVKNLKMGINLAFTMMDPLIEDKQTFSLSGGSSGGSAITRLSRFSIDPYLLIFPGVIGLNTDLFALTVGPSINFIKINTKLDSWGIEGSSSNNGSAFKIGLFPEIGIDFRPVKFIRVFVRGMYIINDIDFDDIEHISGAYHYSLTQSNIVIRK